MLVIGLTGPSGAGKGLVSQAFASYGSKIIDADAVYHALLLPPSPCLDELTAAFGAHILRPDGRLNRSVLGNMVFSDPRALAKLNEISHRYVKEEIRRQILALKTQNVRTVVLDAPQLFESGCNQGCNIVVSVLADEKLRLGRIMARDNISAEDALRRMHAQHSDAFFRTHSDYIIENNASPDDIYPAVKQILTNLGVIEP